MFNEGGQPFWDWATDFLLVQVKMCGGWKGYLEAMIPVWYRGVLALWIGLHLSREIYRRLRGLT